MKRRILLKKTMAMARTGDRESYESFYILTVQETYGKICRLVKDREQAEALLAEVYVALYHQVHLLPVEEEDLSARIEEEIYRSAEKRLGTELGRLELHDSFDALSEERAATIWLRIEELAGMNREDTDEKDGWLSYVSIILKIAASAAALILAAVFLFRVWYHFTGAGEEAQEVSVTEAVFEETKPAQVVLESEKREPGWQQDPDRKMYYVMKSGIPADGQVNIGKQTMTFSRKGELTLIGDNRAVTANRNLSFDEDVKYEVRNGDIYRTDSEAGEVCVVHNGHVTQADIRCGYLWYISKYQVPNSDKVRTVIYRALPDGERSEELYATDSMMEAENFQLTSRWLYYLNGGKLFRKGLESDKTEYLAGKVEHYFAWEDTAYYMKDRTLEHVSAGAVYSGVEAGYQIERMNGGFVLLDSDGQGAIPSGEGEVQVGDRIYEITGGVIAAVKPAERLVGENSYYIEDSGSDRKIYWKDHSGARGLIPQEGLAADSLCIAGNWLYYSARTAQYGGECNSRIYRVNLDTMEVETVGEPFRGRMRNLYYFENVQTIYGEYLPSAADPDDIHGEIARVSEDSVAVISNSPAWPDGDENDALEIVMADESRIYCLYHTCSHDSTTGEMAWNSTEALEVELAADGRNEED